MSANKSLTVGEYSAVVLRKYMQGAFSNDAQENLSAAAEEIYVLLRKLIDASGDKTDLQAPLKAWRHAIDQISAQSPEGAEDPRVDQLFALSAQLEALCVDRAVRGTDPGAVQVQAVHRYRLTRLLIQDTWESYPELKLRILQLMFSFMVNENDLLLQEARDTPSLKLGRSLSIGRSRRADLGPRRHSAWTNAIAELQRMPGSKLFPLIKLLLIANMARATPPTAASTPLEGLMTPTKQPTEGSSVNDQPTPVPSADLDLLSVGEETPPHTENAPSRKSSGSFPITDDPFAALAGDRPPVPGHPDHLNFQYMAIHGDNNTRPVSPASSFSSMQTSTVPSTGIHTPQQNPGQQVSFHTSAVTAPSMPIPHSTPGHHAGYSPYTSAPPSYGSYGNSSGHLQGYGRANVHPGSLHSFQAGGSGGGSTHFPSFPLPVPQQLSTSPPFEASFDPNSPYLGKEHPFADVNFADISPIHSMKPSAGPQVPPMRGDSK